jgi:hypothetical protein
MGRVNKDFARCALWLALFSGCEVDPHEPDPLFAGAWIDIHGRDRAPEDTCGGTFAYVDAYAGALAEEFGVTEHMGSYRWYSPAQYTAERPCGDAYACTYDRTLNSTLLPHEHELVHLANFAAGACPSALAEGLAEYYSPWGNDANSNDFDLLVARLERPSEDPPDIEYGILGRFAGYLVDRFGITNVLEVCRVTGPLLTSESSARSTSSSRSRSTAQITGPSAHSATRSGRRGASSSMPTQHTSSP